MATQYITLKQAAQKWKSKAWYISKACDAGQIPEAVKLNDEWIIPADLERPNMHLEYKSEVKDLKYEHGDGYKDAIYAMTMDSFPNFDVQTYDIRGRKYIVYSCFSPDSKTTTRETLWRYAMRKATEECKNEDSEYLDEQQQEEELRKIREEDIARMPSSKDLREYYFNRFVEIGFSDTELAELMEKIDEHIAKRNRNFGIE